MKTFRKPTRKIGNILLSHGDPVQPKQRFGTVHRITSKNCNLSAET